MVHTMLRHRVTTIIGEEADVARRRRRPRRLTSPTTTTVARNKVKTREVIRVVTRTLRGLCSRGRRLVLSVHPSMHPSTFRSPGTAHWILKTGTSLASRLCLPPVNRACSEWVALGTRSSADECQCGPAGRNTSFSLNRTTSYPSSPAGDLDPWPASNLGTELPW